MDDLGPVAWPPVLIKTERLVLRESEARDRTAFIELLASPEVNTYLGGPRPRTELERETPAIPEHWPGSFVVELNGAMIGQILLRRATHPPPPRRPPERPTSATSSSPTPGAPATPPSPAPQPSTWFDEALPGEPIILTTQSANTPSMRLAATLGFTELETLRGLGHRTMARPTSPDRAAKMTAHSARIAQALRVAREHRIMTAPTTATAIREVSDDDWAWRMLLQGRDHLRLLLRRQDGSEAAWEAAPGTTGHAGFDILLAALAAHEFEAAGEEPPKTGPLSRLSRTPGSPSIRSWSATRSLSKHRSTCRD